VVQVCVRSTFVTFNKRPCINVAMSFSSMTDIVSDISRFKMSIQVYPPSV
jgi:hypothetical protein